MSIFRRTIVPAMVGVVLCGVRVNWSAETQYE
jgi:hypothetical protein